MDRTPTCVLVLKEVTMFLSYPKYDARGASRIDLESLLGFKDDSSLWRTTKRATACEIWEVGDVVEPSPALITISVSYCMYARRAIGRSYHTLHTMVQNTVVLITPAPEVSVC